MSTIGQKKQVTRQRAVRLFTNRSHPFAYAAGTEQNWEKQEGFRG